MQRLPATATSGLKLRAASWKITLPAWSPLYPLTKAQSPVIASSKRYFFPLMNLLSLGYDEISAAPILFSFIA